MFVQYLDELRLVIHKLLSAQWFKPNEAELGTIYFARERYNIS